MAARGTLVTFRVALVFSAIALLFLFGVSMPLTDGDSAYYASVSLRAMSTGDWLTFKDPSERGIVDKPPVTFWLIGASMAVLGVSDLAVRLWHTLMALGVVVLTGLVAARLPAGAGAGGRPGGPGASGGVPGAAATTGALSAAIMSTTLLFFYSSQVPQQDIPTLFFSTLALFFHVELTCGRRMPFLGATLGGVAGGLAILTRGVAGAAYAVAPIAAYGLASAVLAGRGTPGPSRRSALVRLARDVPPVALFGAAAAAVALPWFVLEYRLLGLEFARVFLGGNVRFFRPLRSEGGLLYWLQYFPLFLVGFIPWSGLMPGALGRAVGSSAHGLRHRRGLSARRRAEAHADLFLLAWFAFGFGFPFLIKWRVIRYLLPAFPPMAILCARLVVPLYTDRRAPAAGRTLPRGSPDAGAARSVAAAGLISVGVALPLLAGTLLLLSRQFGGVAAVVVPVILPFLVTLSAAVVLFCMLGLVLRRPRLALESLAVLTGLSLVTLVGSFTSGYDKVLPWRSMVEAVRAQARPGDVIVVAQENPFVRYYASTGDPAGVGRAPGRGGGDGDGDGGPSVPVRVGEPLAEVGKGRAAFYITEEDPREDGELERLARSGEVEVSVLRQTDVGPALLRVTARAR